MSNKYFAGNRGYYIFCDICGQACYAFEAHRLETATGRPGLMVCPNDHDNIDPGLMAYYIQPEKPVAWTRINHQDVTNGTAPLDYESATSLGA